VSRGYIARSKSNDWRTPGWLVRAVDRWYRVATGRGIELDPCASREGPRLARRNWTRAGLTRRWEGNTFVNPPYSELAAWIRKAAESPDALVVLLVPARTDTRAFQQHVLGGSRASALVFLAGRLRFEGAPAPAPFPSCLVFFGRPDGPWPPPAPEPVQGVRILLGRLRGRK
jgi:hypothetical protein